MTETKKQIEQLKKVLPSLKEKVFAVALLLCLSVVMVASVSYAWVTMSTSPEVGAVKTTVAANGALEIALSDYDGLEPDSSAVGDSFAAADQTTHAANTSWGNLVNLSSGYGVDNLVLRPAKLDLTSPNYIYSVKYGQDGRVEGIISDFGFTTWYQTDKTTDAWAFVSPADENYSTVFQDGIYGVRAISSVTYKGQESVNAAKLRILAENQAVIKSNYENNLMGNEENQVVIQSLVNQYLTHTIDKAAYDFMPSAFSNPGELDDLQLDGKTYIPALTEMMRYFLEDIIVPAGDTLVYIANLQSTSKTEYTLDMLLADDLNRTALLNDGVKLTALGYNSATGKYGTNAYKTLYTKVQADLTTMQSLWEDNGQPKATFTWGEIKGVINHLIDINNVRIYDKDGKYYRVGYIVSDAGGTDETLDLVNNKLYKTGEGIVRVELVNGTLKEFEQLSGAAGSLPVKISAHKKALGMNLVNYDGDANITTNADHNNSYFRQDQALAQEALGAQDNRSLVAADTYGMVLDLWVRTNADSSMLTLNGTPEVVERQEPVTVNVAGHDAPREVYVYSYYTGETTNVGGVSTENTESFEVYEVFHDPDGPEGTEENGETVNLPEDYYYYRLSNHTMVYEYVLQDQGDGSMLAVASDTPLSKDSVDKNGQPALSQKTTIVYDVVGFTAANRIWQEDDKDLPTPSVGEISTTQGSGSCYIFHASDDEEYENTKNLLKNLRLVFLDENGLELSRARLDTDRIYAENGKYTVPLYLESFKESVVDEEGNVVATGLCRLEKNVARRISVLIYLEGENLENDMVMSAESVIGSLNLQFDSTADLRSIGDSDLETEMISLSASIDKTSWAYTGSAETAKLSATISGLAGQRVEATFIRMYNETQGSRMQTVELLQGEDGTWTADMPFDCPGNYVLNALTIGGVDYALSEPIRVTVSGFDVSYAGFAPQEAVLTVDRSTKKTVTVTLDSEVLPQTVVAQFVSEDEKGNKSFVNANLSNNGANWVGDAVFTKSGQYTLTYLIMDGEPYSLPESMQKSFMAYLGLTADVVLERFEPDDSGRYTKESEQSYVYLSNGAYVQNASGNYVKLKDGEYVPYEGKIYQMNGGTYTEVADISKVSAADNIYAFDEESSEYVKIHNGTYKIGKLDYTFTGAETIFAYVRIYDDAGVQMDTLGALKLYYKAAGSSTVESGYVAELTWNGSEYAGTFSATKPGKFVFGELQLGANERISAARTAPELSIISTVPPSVTSLGDLSITYENGKAYYNVYIENAATATRYVVLSDGTKDYTVELVESKTGTNTYLAEFPDLDGDATNGTVNSNGEWTVKGFRFSNVYANGQFYEDGQATYEIDTADEDYTIVNYLVVETSSMQLGGTSLATATDTFMTAYSMKEQGLSVTVKAPIGKLTSTNYVPGDVYADRLGSVSVQLSYDASTSQAYGGYTGASNNTTTPAALDYKTVGPDRVTFTFVEGKDVTLQGAGKYAISATATLKNSETSNAGTTFNAASGSAVEIFSKKPTVTITAIGPTGTFSVDTITSGQVNDTSDYEKSNSRYRYFWITDGNHTTGYSNSHTSTSATVYYSCSHTDTIKYGYTNWRYTQVGAALAVIDNVDYHDYTQPTVTITLANKGNAETVTLSFGTDAHVYATKGGTEKASYSWTADGASTMYIGQHGVADNDDDTKTVAGTITANVLVLVYDGVTYTVSIPTITINNPY